MPTVTSEIAPTTSRMKAEQPPVPLRDKMALTVQEVADMCGFNYYFVHEQIKLGRLAAVAPGGNKRSKRVRPADVDEWLKASPWEPEA
ncbi:helix-turn-helix domain-containing protein [Nocardia bovistercoris]|uniref:Helix-turn-helix domain-containing protein n=1 Tax=Nocardia bovistercoris TaxID=2785916 RepID=A0A931IES9_9NOCA|nr:helix-turn-helix domain-containing protein [Nocardia bovistercoris]MBH0778772.1 helix-turn-helix domain-containing protein [Nocardia bovistercoris]